MIKTKKQHLDKTIEDKVKNMQEGSTIFISGQNVDHYNYHEDTIFLTDGYVTKRIMSVCEKDKECYDEFLKKCTHVSNCLMKMGYGVQFVTDPAELPKYSKLNKYVGSNSKTYQILKQSLLSMLKP